MNEITHCDRWPRLWSRNEHIKEAIDVIFIAFANTVLLQLHESYAYLLRVTSHHVIFISLSEVTLPQASASDFKYNRVILERAAGRAGSGGPSSRHGQLPVWNRSGQAVDQVYIYPYALRQSVRDNTLHTGRRIHKHLTTSSSSLPITMATGFFKHGRLKVSVFILPQWTGFLHMCAIKWKNPKIVIWGLFAAFSYCEPLWSSFVLSCLHSLVMIFLFSRVISSVF